MTATTPKGQINAPDQLDCMSTLLPDTSMAYMQGKVQRLQEMLAAQNAEVERLQKLKDYWADIVHSERKEYNALQDSTKFDEATILNLRNEVGRLNSEIAANANLIAAAPQLLLALQTIMAEVAGCEKDEKYQAARAAINKATGVKV